jgi:DnaJ like chaperone protein
LDFYEIELRRSAFFPTRQWIALETLEGLLRAQKKARILAADEGLPMSIWGKLAGAAAGLAAGGPIGAVLGGLGHHVIDHDKNKGRMAEHQVAFTVGVIALGAKMAKADGIVTRDEVIAFKEVFKVPEGEMKHVSRIFDLAKQDVVGYDAYAKQLASLMNGNRKLLEDVLEGLFHIALADGVFHPNEEQFLAEVAKRFGFTNTEFSYFKARHVNSGGHSPYEILGVTPEIGNDALKIHYRKLVADNHPDKMMARGVPPEFVAMATKKIAAINAAYDEVAKERRI